MTEHPQLSRWLQEQRIKARLQVLWDGGSAGRVPWPKVLSETVEGHDLIAFEPEPEGWAGRCACGWSATVSFYDIPNGHDLLAEIIRRYGGHIRSEPT